MMFLWRFYIPDTWDRASSGAYSKEREAETQRGIEGEKHRGRQRPREGHKEAQGQRNRDRGKIDRERGTEKDTYKVRNREIKEIKGSRHRARQTRRGRQAREAERGRET